MKNITLITLFLGAFAFITSAYASVTASGSVSSDYVWRGESLSGGDAVVQGGLEYTDTNYYAGAWVSTLGNDNGEELNLYVGTELSGFDLAITKYVVNSEEITELSVGYSLAGFDLFYAQNEEESDETFMSVSYGFDINESISGSLTYGEWSDEAVINTSDYIQLDISYGAMTFSVVDADNRDDLDFAVSYALSL
ncbi:MAG: hypothetical protein P8I61_01330 [Opitutae bacterium]|nr:hypothetical protein [Opitutae bacterium]